MLLSALLVGALAAKAVPSQTITLKNGSVLHGYIQRQDGRGHLTINTESAIVCLANSDIKVDESTVDTVQLSPAWKRWLASNERYAQSPLLRMARVAMNLQYASNAEKPLEQADFETRLKASRKIFQQVFLIERGSTVRFVDLSANSYEVAWDDIVSISAEPRPKNSLSGIARTYVLKNGREVKGEYAGESLSTISLYQPDGTVESIRFDDVSRISISPINPGQDIFEQSPLLDIVRV